MRSTALILSCVLAGCSFVDDFDKFRSGAFEGDGAGDGGEPDVSDLDGGGVDPADGAVDPSGRDTGTPGGGRDASTVDTGIVPVPVDAGSKPRCGDGNTDPALGEKCDDGNSVAGDGCEPVTCTVTPPAVCGGVSCNDNDLCTLDMCAPIAGCMNKLIDADKDGFAPATCKPGSAAKGGDCNDANAAVSPSALEVCDGVDNDCDGMIDEGSVALRCYPDRDGDGFANLDGMPRMGCMCPAGHVAIANPNDRTKHDCWDDPDNGGDTVYPLQTKFFSEPYGIGPKQARSFDYDCNEKADQQYVSLGAGGCGGLLDVLLCSSTAGFVGATSPKCGEEGEYVTCAGAVLGGCSGQPERRTQACR